MLSQPFIDPIEGGIAVKNIDFNQPAPPQPMPDSAGNLAKIGEHSTTDHQDQSTAKQLVRSELVLKKFPNCVHEEV